MKLLYYTTEPNICYNYSIFTVAYKKKIQLNFPTLTIAYSLKDIKKFYIQTKNQNNIFKPQLSLLSGVLHKIVFIFFCYKLSGSN